MEMATADQGGQTGTAERSRLTPAQRLHLDVYGYVLLENILAPDEVARMKDALYRLKAEPDLDAHRVYVNRRRRSTTGPAQTWCSVTLATSATMGTRPTERGATTARPAWSGMRDDLEE